MAISIENYNFSHPRHDSVNFMSPVTAFPLELGISSRCQKPRVIALPGRTRNLTVSSAMLIHSTNVSDRRTDGRTDGHRTTAQTALTHNVAR